MIETKTHFYNILMACLLMFAVFSPVSIAGTNTAWILLLAVWISGTVLKKELKIIHTPLNAPLIIFTCIMIISVVLSENIKSSLSGIKSLGLAAIFFLTASSIQGKKQVRALITVLIIFTTISCIYGVFQHFSRTDFLGHKDFLIWPPYRSSGFFNLPLTFAEHVGMVLFVVIALLLAESSPSGFILLSLSGLAITAGVIFSYCRMMWLAVLLGLFALLFLMGKKIIAIIMILMITVTVFVVIRNSPNSEMSQRIKSMVELRNPYNNNMDRIILWNNSLKMIKAHPLKGIGLNNFKKTYCIYAGPEDKPQCHSHSNFLQVAIEAGLLGLGVFLWVIIIIFKALYRIYRTTNDTFLKAVVLGTLAAMVSFIIGGLTEYNYGDSEVLMLLYFLLGLSFAIPGINLKD